MASVTLDAYYLVALNQLHKGLVELCTYSLKQVDLQPDALTQVSLLCWSIWKARNDYIFCNVTPSPFQHVERACSMAQEYIAACLTSAEPRHNCNPFEVSGTLFQVNGLLQSVVKAKAKGIIAAVATDCKGIIIQYRIKIVDHILKPLVLDSLAVRLALQLASEQHWTHIIVEGGAKVVMDTLCSGSAVHHVVDHLIAELGEMSYFFVSCYFQWIPTSVYSLADSFAKLNSPSVSFARPG